MSNTTTCPFCPKSVSWQGLDKHIFSRQHLDQHVIPHLQKEKGSHRMWRNSSRDSSCPQLFIGNRMLYLCFGCKKCKSYLPSDHLSSDCSAPEEHLTTLKKMLDVVPVQEESGDVSALKKEIEALKKRLKEADRLYDLEAELRQEADDFSEKIFGKSYADMNEEEREDILEAAKSGKILSVREESLEESG
jgi:hypothetical protein